MRRTNHRTGWLSLLLVTLVAGCQGMSGSGGAGADVTASGDSLQRILANGELRVGISGVQPPLNMKNASGELIGLDVDLARALAQAMNLQLVFVERPFSKLLSDLEDGDVDLVISSLTITPARNARVAFAGPYLVSGATLLGRKGEVEDFSTIEALDSPDRTWAALAGSTSADLIGDAFPQAALHATDDIATAIEELREGKVDGLITDLPRVRFIVSQEANSDLEMRPAPFTTEPLGIALPPNAPLFANLVQNYLNTLEYTGVLIQLKSKWLNPGAWIDELP